MPFIDIIIFAVIAVLLVLRLRTVLGQRTGYDEQPPRDNRFDNGSAEVISIDSGRRADIVEGHGIDALRKADRSFSEKEFLNGAAAAFQRTAGVATPPKLLRASYCTWLRDNASDLPDAAAYLGTSISTLKRRLREHACTYQEVLDSARREQALVELLLNDASVDAISERLHFHDSSNFRRAFKRWTGTTPSLLKSAFQ